MLSTINTMKKILLTSFVLLSLSSVAQKADNIPIDATLRVDKSGKLGVDVARASGVFSSPDALRKNRVDTTQIYRLKLRGTIGDFIYDPADVTSKDDSVMVIVTSEGKRLKRSYDYIDPLWWGAKPGDYVDDSYAIQRAVNYAVNNQAKPRVYFSQSGQYRAKNIILAKYAGGQPQFFSLTMEGPSGAVGGGLGVELYCDNGNAAIIHVQLGRNLVIRNIGFAGVVAAPSGDVVSRTQASWTNNGAVRTNRYSPNAGISIDPFLNDIAEANRYPGLSSWYKGVPYAGTSNMLIENCAFSSLAVGIMVSASGQANGDNIVCRGGTAYNCKAFWAAGQLQSRANVIDGVYTFTAIETFVDGKSYGLQNGALPEVKNSSLNFCKYLYNIGSEFSGMSFIGCYAEGAWALGKNAGVNPVSFTDCFINLLSDNTRFAPPVLAEGGLLNFRGGKIEWSDNTWLAALPFNNVQVIFSGTLLRGGVPFITSAAHFGNLQMENIELSNGGQPVRVTKNTVLTGFSEGGKNGSILMPFNRAISDEGFVFENTGPAVERLYTGDVVKIRVNESAKTATFTAENGGRFGVGDVICADQPLENSSDIFSATSTTLGYVSHVSGNTVTLNRIPQGIHPNTSYRLFIVRIPRWMARMTGNVTKGSASITNIQAHGAALLPGQLVKGYGLGAGTRIVSVNGNTAKISVPAYETASNVELSDAKIRVTRDNQPLYIYGGNYQALQFSRVYHAGDEIMNTTGAAGIRSWYCTKAGKIGSASPPVFAEIRQPAGRDVSSAPARPDGSLVHTANLPVRIHVADGDVASTGYQEMDKEKDGGPVGEDVKIISNKATHGDVCRR
jgi:hypothetical protein